MAYISSDEVKVIRNNLKKAFPQFKFSVTKEHHSTVRVAIMEGPVEFVPGKAHAQLNHYHPQNYANADLLQKMIAIVMEKHWDKSDIMTDYFHCAFYVSMEQGKWDTPYKLVAAAPERKDYKVVIKRTVVEYIEITTCNEADRDAAVASALEMSKNCTSWDRRELVSGHEVASVEVVDNKIA